MGLGKSISEIIHVARKADCKEMPRVSISFNSMSDKARFEHEVKREFSHISLRPVDSMSLSEFTVMGVKVRIL